MKKLYTLLLLTSFSLTQLNAQNYLMNFDGVDDYVNLGSNAVTGARTVELWFTPGLTITATSLADYAALISRQDATQNDEINLMFDPSSAGAYAGRIVFQRNVAGVYHYIASNSNTWNAGTCYHVAAVIDPTSGMKMYINGALQADTDPYTGAPGIASEIAAIGCLGDLFAKCFNGRIDEVRIWTTARTADEIGGAYQYTVPGTISGLSGYWNFNEGSGTTTDDVSPNSNIGTISGATFATSGSCVVGVEEEITKNELNISVYPNPITENSIIQVKKPAGITYSLNVIDVTGKIIWGQSNLSQDMVSLSNLKNLYAGIYFVNVTLNNANATSLSTKLLVR